MPDNNKKRSAVWNFFTERGVNQDQAKCNFCSKILSFKGGATGNLLRHLKLVHPTVNTAGESSKNNNSQDERNIDDPSTSSAPGPSAVPENLRSENPKDPEPVGLLPAKRSKPQSVLTAFVRRPLTDRKTQEIHNSLVKLLVKNYLPIQLVESEHFRLFVNNLNNSYQVPSRKTVSNTLIPQLYNMVQEKVRNTLDLVTSCCLTTDGWTSCTNTSFISVTAHYITTDNLMKSSLLDCYEYSERHTAENLCSELQRIAREWNISNKIVAIASDNAANILAAIRLTGWKQVPCFAHTLNLIVQSSLETIAELQSKIKKIVEFFKRSTQASCKLKEMQTQLGKPILSLKQDCVTRWNSTFDMINRILEVKDSLMSVIAINFPNLPNIDNNDILIMEGITDILKVFKDVTIEMSSEKQVTTSKVIVLSHALKKHCSSYLQMKVNAPLKVKELGNSLLENLNRRFHLVEENKIYSEATLMDPRFKRYGFTSESALEKTKQSLISQVAAMIITTTENSTSVEEKSQNNQQCTVSDTQTTSLSIWSDFDQKVSHVVQNTNPKAAAIIEVTKYLEEPLHPRTQNPLEWWAQRCHVYPQLYKLAMKKLCIVATSVPSERVFSKAGLTITDLRNRLKGKRVSEILFLNANL